MLGSLCSHFQPVVSLWSLGLQADCASGEGREEGGALPMSGGGMCACLGALHPSSPSGGEQDDCKLLLSFLPWLAVRVCLSLCHTCGVHSGPGFCPAGVSK